jgi:hypothetical protein
MRQHMKSRNLILNHLRHFEEYSMNTWFSKVTSYEGYSCAQVFVGNKSHKVSQYGVQSEGSGPAALLDFFCSEGVPLSI